jgi:hypothetical protein
MKNLILVIFLLTEFNLFAQSFFQKGATLLNMPFINHIRMGEIIDMSKDGNTIAVGYSGSTNSKGAVKVFDWNGSNWVQRGTEILGDNNSDLACIVSLSGNGLTLAIGSPYWDNLFQSNTYQDVGKVRVFDWNGSNWILRSTLNASLQFNGTTPNLGLHIDLSYDANSMIISAPGYAANGNNGLYVVYDWNGSIWSLSNSIALSTAPTDVSISANKSRIAYSRSNFSSSLNGRVTIMNKSGSTLINDATFVSDSLNDNFGGSLELSGDGNTCIIGANHGKNNGFTCGYVKVYQRSQAGQWTQKGSTLYGDAFSSFGKSVAINYSGNRIFVGKPENFSSHPTKKGAVKVYDWDGANWNEVFQALGDRNNDNFGYSVACDSLGNTFTVGTPSSDSLYTDAGTVKVFEICQPSNSTLNISSCGSYSINGQTYQSSGSFIQTLTNSIGCDSTLTINLNILSSSASTLNITACNNYVLNGITYTISGSYTQNLTNYLGCDSIINLNLTINSAETGVSINQNSIVSLATSALYQWIDCDNNNLISSATSQTFTPISSGNFAVEVTQNGCTDTSSCVNFLITGVESMNSESFDLMVYPNPAESDILIKSSDDYNLQIFSIDGRLHNQTTIKTGNNYIDLTHLTVGIYILEFRNDTKKIIKKLTIK